MTTPAEPEGVESLPPGKRRTRVDQRGGIGDAVERGLGAPARIADKLNPNHLVSNTPILDELTTQLDRTRALLTGDAEGVTEAALDRVADREGIEARIAAELSVREPLAHPGRFPEAHRLTMRALEVLDREGSRNPSVPRLGPLSPAAEFVVEYIARYIVKSYAQGVVGTLKKLYARREAQCEPGSPERRLLSRSRMEVERIAPSFGGGGLGAPLIVAGGILLPLLASLSQYAGAIDFANRWVLFGGIAILFVLSLALSSMLLQGAAIAHRRSRLIMQQPLAALWETLGHAGNPPEDDSLLFGTIAIALTALVWFVLPAGAAVVYFVF